MAYPDLIHIFRKAFPGSLRKICRKIAVAQSEPLRNILQFQSLLIMPVYVILDFPYPMVLRALSLISRRSAKTPFITFL